MDIAAPNGGVVIGTTPAVQVIEEILARLRQVEDGMSRESLQLHSNLLLELRGPDGQLKDRRLIHNLVCTAGKNTILKASSAEYLNAYAYIAIGTGTTAPAIGDTALQTEVARSPVQTPTNPSATVYEVTYTFPAGTGTGTITEAGLLDAPSAGNIFAHQTFSGVAKAPADTLGITWQIS